MKRFFFCGAAFSLGLVLSGCGEIIPDYSSRFTHVKVYNKDGTSTEVLVPEACLTLRDDPASDEAEEPRLPPGCANNYNLQRMVESKRDLTRGRTLGPAPAAPVARAAQKYLSGGGNSGAGGAASTSGSVSVNRNGVTSEQPLQSGGGY